MNECNNLQAAKLENEEYFQMVCFIGSEGNEHIFRIQKVACASCEVGIWIKFLSKVVRLCING